VITGDLVASAQSAMLNGDDSSAMVAAADDGDDCLSY
jgi:hypothetical protein